MVAVTDRLIPADPQPTPVQLDGGSAIVADALHVRIHGPLDRTPNADEPAIDLAFDIVNGWLERVRLLSQAWPVRPVTPSDVIWSLTYLDDDGGLLEAETGLVRGRYKARFEIPAMPVFRSDGLWTAVADIPADYSVPPWESLLMDAFGLLPEAGPALILAAASIETRIDAALEQHADQRGGSARALWSWLSERAQYWRRPSFEERLSDMLTSLGAPSLKENTELWEAFQNIRNARNNYAHAGVAKIGNRGVSSGEAVKLLQKTRSIIDWLEESLPTESRRPRYEGQHQFQAVQLIQEPSSSEPPAASQPPPRDEV